MAEIKDLLKTLYESKTSKISRYLLPDRFYFVDRAQYPQFLTANGKLNIKKMSCLEQLKEFKPFQFDLYQGDNLSESVYEFISDVTGKTGNYDDSSYFFVSGGTSIQGFVIATELSQVFNLDTKK